jgi:hypothetical protein
MEFILFTILAALALGLGFIALLKQKTYIDTATGAATTIDVPLVGKMQTNFPALVFVFVGLAFGFLAIKMANDAYRAVAPITVEGQLKTQKNEVTDWAPTEINVQPSYHQAVSPTGHYTIVVNIPKWESFDDWLEAISFQLGALSGRISPGAKNDSSKINKKTTTYWNADVDMKLEK